MVEVVTKTGKKISEIIKMCFYYTIYLIRHYYFFLF